MNLSKPSRFASTRRVGLPQRRREFTRRGDMRKEYDFSKAERGKLYRPDATFNLPVYLDEEVQAFVQAIADRRKTDLSTVVNELLRGDMQLAEAMK